MAIRWTGLGRLQRHLTRKQTAILVYHDPSPERLDAHLTYLAARYSFIRLGTLVDAMHSGDWATVPPRSLVVTIDDGHHGNFALVDVFRRHGLVPTIYLVSEVVATARRFWFMAGDFDPNIVKELTHAQRLTWLQEQLDWSPTREFPGPPQALTAEQIGVMRPHVDFEAHTLTHPVLTMCDDSVAWREIDEGRRRIAELLDGEASNHFSYPNGDYGPREIEMARRAGFRSARTIDIGWNGPGDDPYRLRVTGVADNASIHWLAAQLTGMPSALGYARKTRRFDGRSPVIMPKG